MGPPCWTAVATPELIGVLVWWGVVLSGPLFFLRRWRRRRFAQRHRHFGGSAIDVRGSLAPLPGRAPKEVHRTPVMAVSGETSLPASSGVPVSPATLQPLCRYVDFRRRLELAVAELERRLAALPGDRWRIEPYPLTGERRNTLVVLGETGVFVISATYGPGHWDDVVAVNMLARKIQSLLPGYAGEVHGAVCHPFSSIRPRHWHRQDEHGDWVGSWLVGGDSVTEWLEHFGLAHGLGVADLVRFDDLAKPNWLGPAIPTPPSWPPVPGAPPQAHP